VQRIAILILILAVAGGVWFVIHDSETAPTDLPSDPAAKAAAEADTQTPGLNRGTRDPLPTPDPVVQRLKSPARLLFLGQLRGTWNATMLMVCGSMRGLSYRSWFLHDLKGGAGVAGAGRGMQALTDKPTADYLENEDVTVLMLDVLDPNAYGMDFWKAVRKRVQSGRMGLFVHPGYPVLVGEGAVSEHPLLSHPILKELLPVTRAALLEGTPVPGTFAELQGMSPTSEGTRHPASRLVAVPEVSMLAWAKATAGDGALSTQFCYPVEEIRSNAQTLVTCDAASSIPMLVATMPGAKERVLWMGNVDFSSGTHKVRAKDVIQKILVNHWIVWLAGQSK